MNKRKTLNKSQCCSLMTPANNSIERKRLTLFVIAFLCSPASAGGLVATYFWCSVLCHSGDYVSAAFHVSEVSYRRFGTKTGSVVALGQISGTNEILYSWNHYCTKRQAFLMKGRRLPVMFNSKETRFHYSGRNLRVLSLRDYNLAARNVIYALALNALAPILWIVYLRYAEKDNMGWSGWEEFGNLTTKNETNLREKE